MPQASIQGSPSLTSSPQGLQENSGFSPSFPSLSPKAVTWPSHPQLFSPFLWMSKWTQCADGVSLRRSKQTNLRSQERQKDRVAVSSLESRFYKGGISTRWSQRGNQANLATEKGIEPGAGKLGLPQPSFSAQVNWDKAAKRADWLASGHHEAVLWLQNKE